MTDTYTRAALDPTDPYAREHQIFPRLSEDQMKRLRCYGREEVLDCGTALFTRGERGVDFFVVIDGRIEIVEHDAAGREKVITVHGPSQFTGEIDLFNDRRILVDGRVIARDGVGEARILRIPRQTFRRLMSTETDLGEMITRAFILRRTGFLQHGEAGAVLIGDASGTSALRSAQFLRRNGYPMRQLQSDEQEAKDLMQVHGLGQNDLPALVAPDGVALSNPTIPQLAETLGLTEAVDPDRVHDLIVVGAGPSGLSAAVYAASEGLDTLVVEQEAPGGQAGTSSRIENYLGFPTGISGQALAGRAWVQSQRFGARVAVSRAATLLDCSKLPFRVSIGQRHSAQARAVVLATGATYRKLGLARQDEFENKGLHYAATALEAQLCEDTEVAVVGGGNSAGQAAVFLSRFAKHVHVLVRSDGLAASMSDYLIQRIDHTSNITLRTRSKITELHGDTFLEDVTIEGPEGSNRHAIGHVFVMIGAVPNTDWLNGCVEVDKAGFIRTGVDVTERRVGSAFETSRPGVFAVGDIRSGSVKRVASGVGEGSVCISAVHGWLSEYSDS